MRQGAYELRGGGPRAGGAPALQLEEDFIKANPEWVRELQIMVSSKVKAEIQALSSFGFQYLSQVPPRCLLRSDGNCQQCQGSC